MKRIINFGKIDWYGRGRNIYPVDVTVELTLQDKDADKPIFSCSGNVWNMSHTDIVCGGQCLDDLLPFLKNNKQFTEIHRLWKLYHLNDMHAGTPEQEEALIKAGIHGWANEYTKACDYLKSVGLYEVEVDGEPYKFGHSWLYQPIPADDLQKIKKLIEISDDD